MPFKCFKICLSNTLVWHKEWSKSNRAWGWWYLEWNQRVERPHISLCNHDAHEQSHDTESSPITSLRVISCIFIYIKNNDSNVCMNSNLSANLFFYYKFSTIGGCLLFYIYCQCMEQKANSSLFINTFSDYCIYSSIPKYMCFFHICSHYWTVFLWSSF